MSAADSLVARLQAAMEHTSARRRDAYIAVLRDHPWHACGDRAVFTDAGATTADMSLDWLMRERAVIDADFALWNQYAPDEFRAVRTFEEDIGTCEPV